MTPQARGWLPIRIGLDAVTGQPVARWMEFGSTKLAEPFFEQTVAKLRRGDPPANEAVTDVDTVLRVARGLAPVTPSGFIFHVSRCGSTLISNALKTAEQAVVVSEAPALSILLHPDAESFTAGAGESIYRAVISLLAGYRTDAPAPVVVKVPSWNILFWRVVRRFWPEVPCVAVIREPVEVMAASLGGGGWMELKKSPEVVRKMFGWQDLPRPVEAMSGAEYAARVLRSFYGCAGEMAEEGCRILDYSDIDAGEIRLIAESFGLELGAAGLEEILAANAKDPEGKPFREDHAGQRRLATGLVRSAALQWAAGPYKELRRNC